MIHNLFPHHSKCTANYPEKPKGEPAQLITKIRISPTEVVYQCVDCGGHILTKEKENANETNSTMASNRGSKSPDKHGR